MPDKRVRSRYFFILTALLGLFCLRVLGQALVAFWQVPHLPTMEDWYSGLLPYKPLLCCQILIIILFSKICLDFGLGKGYFVDPKFGLGKFLLRFGGIYLFAMIVRYVIRMSLYPLERWTGGSIPIFFHWVLAAFLLTLGIYHFSRGKMSGSFVPEKNNRATKRFSSALAWTVRIGIILWSSWQLLPTVIASQLGLERPHFAVRAHRNVRTFTTENTQYQFDLFRPLRAGPTPTVLLRTQSGNYFKRVLYEDLVARCLAERGYTVVAFQSENEQDKDALSWVSNQPWFNGTLLHQRMISL